MILLSRFWSVCSTLFLLMACSSNALDLNGDGISDVYQRFYKLPANPALDSDGDGFSNLQESIAGTDPYDGSDTPGAMFRCYIEQADNGWDVSWLGVRGKNYEASSSNDLGSWNYLAGPILGNDDWITLTDVVSNTPPAKKFYRIKTVLSPDSDLDGLDAYEESLLGTLDSEPDSDHDGMPDAWEFQYGFNPLNSADAVSDFDGDGVSNLNEYMNNTNPTDPSNSSGSALQIVIGNQQSGPPNSYVSVPMGVRITKPVGQSAAFNPVTISVTDGGGAISLANTSTATTQTLSAVTDTDGFLFFYYRNPAGFNTTSHISVTTGSPAMTAVFTEATPANLNPANNNFSAASSITGDSGTINGINVGATTENSEPSHTIYPGGKSIWYKWTAATTGTVNFNTVGSSFDTTCAAYDGTTLSNLALLANNNDDPSADEWSMVSHVSFKAVQGRSYYVAVDGFKGQVGNIKLNWSKTAGPANDYFADAKAIAGESGTDTFAFDGATSETGEPIHAGNYYGTSVWYRWVSPSGGTVRFDTVGSSFNTVCAIYKGTSLSSLTEIASNDDALNAQVSTSSVTFPVSNGEIFYIAFGGRREQSGTAALNWQVMNYNNAFADAQEIVGSSGSVTGDNLNATKETGEPLHAGNTGGASIWYRWQASSADTVAFDTVGSDFDTTLAVYTGVSVNALTNVASNDDFNGRTSKVSFSPVVGQSYLIAVDGYSSSKGHVILNWNAGSFARAALFFSKGSPPFKPPFPPPNPDIPAPAIAAATAANEEECEEPAQPNYGEAGEIRYVDGVEEFSTSRTVNLGIKAKTSDPDCSQEINIQHKIVTVNTPRSRDLPGKLTLTLKSGDASLIEIKHGGSTYALGTAIPVLETGHSGCGVHTWHYGQEPFEFIGKQKGTLVLEAKVDPDPDDGGDGQPTQILTITVNVIKLTYTLLPEKRYLGISAKSSWPSQEATTREKKITVTSDPSQFAEQVVIKVKEVSSNPNPEYTPPDKGTLTQDSTDKKVWKYEAFMENFSEKHPLTKKVIFTGTIDDEDLCPPFEFEVRPVYLWLTEPGKHQHGANSSAHLPTDDDYNKAWQYVKAKYNLQLGNLAKVYFQRNLSNDGETYVGGGVGRGYCALGLSAFGGRTSSSYGENWLGGTLLHENVHGGQSLGNTFSQKLYYLTHSQHDFDLQFEVPAYQEQLRRANDVGLPDDDKSTIQHIIDTVIAGGTVGGAVN